MKSSLQTLLGVSRIAALRDGRQLVDARRREAELARQLLDIRNQIELIHLRRQECRCRSDLGGEGGLFTRLSQEETRCRARLQSLSERQDEVFGWLQAGRKTVSELENILAQGLARKRSLRRVIEREACAARQRGHCRQEAELLEQAGQRCTDSGHPV